MTDSTTPEPRAFNDATLISSDSVWIVTAESDSVPGSPMVAFASKAGATAEAVSLTNILLEEQDMPRDATAENWRDRVETLEDETGGGSFVEMYELEMRA